VDSGGQVVLCNVVGEPATAGVQAGPLKREAVAVALDDAGIERAGGARLHYRFEAPGSNPGGAEVWFERYLPHDEIVCTVCG
jgi:hypothetical protein